MPRSGFSCLIPDVLDKRRKGSPGFALPTVHFRMQYRLSTVLTNSDSPLRAAVDQHISSILFLPSTWNSGPAFKTCVVPLSSRQKTLPSQAQGEEVKPRAPGIRSL